MAGLRHAVGLEHRRLVGLLGPFQERGRQRGAARPDEPQRRRRAAVVGLVQDHLVQSRARRQPGGAVLAGLRPEPLRREPARGDDRAALAQRRERGRHQAVNVEQRHHAERHIRLAEPVMRGDRPGRGHEVALTQRDLLGPARRSARMQHEGDIVRAARLERALERGGLAVGQQFGRPVPGRLHADQDCPGGGRRGGGRGGAAGRDQHQPGGDVGQEELVLGRGVCGVQRGRGGAERGHGEQQQHDVRAIGQREGDPVSAADAQPGEPLCERLDPGRGLRVREHLAAVGNDERWMLSSSAREQRCQRLACRPAGPLGHRLSSGSPGDDCGSLVLLAPSLPQPAAREHPRAGAAL